MPLATPLQTDSNPIKLFLCPDVILCETLSSMRRIDQDNQRFKQDGAPMTSERRRFPDAELSKKLECADGQMMISTVSGASLPHANVTKLSTRRIRDPKSLDNPWAFQILIVRLTIDLNPWIRICPIIRDFNHPWLRIRVTDGANSVVDRRDWLVVFEIISNWLV
jgi:hypothetical protein